MNGFNVFEESLRQVSNKLGTFKLKVQDENFEIFESHVHAGRSIICQPYECEDALNSVYVIRGKLYHSNEDRYISSGSWFTFKNLEETQHLSVVEETSLLTIRNKNITEHQLDFMERIVPFMDEIQLKDHYTDEHCNRTGNLAVQIATFMKLDEVVIENILFLGKIHDVGKIKISESILNKPSRLTDDEYDIIKTHPQLGYEIIKHLVDYTHYAEIVRQHHERIDGSGYPDGLKSDEICMEAKVIAVADSFDAMTSDRPYRAGLSLEDAMSEMKRCSGVWYDPDVVNALLAILERTKKIK